MRFQKLATIFLLAGSTVSVSLAQTAAESDPLTQALRRKQSELDAQEAQGVRQVKTPQPNQKPAAPAVVAKPKMDAVPPATVAKPAAVMPPAARSADEDRLVETLRRKQAELDANQGVKSAPALAPVVAGGQAETAKKVRQIEADRKAAEKAAMQSKSSKATQAAYVVPTYDINTKEGKLADLLYKYKTDEITPHEYHMQRAKIIAGQ